jgi:hypothetical protein
MKIIALRGDKDTGKSHAINIAYSFLLKDGYTQLPGHFREIGNPDYEDIIDILIRDRLKVGFVGMGDYVIGQGRSLKSLLQELADKECDVIICSCRNDPKIESAVTAYPNHFFVDKTISVGDFNNRIVNAIDAEKIITHI